MKPVPKLVDCLFEKDLDTLVSQVFERLEPGWRYTFNIHGPLQAAHDAFMILLPRVLGFASVKEYVESQA